MRKASTRMPEQGTQAPSPAPDLIPAKQLTENLHKDWNSERGHITVLFMGLRQLSRQSPAVLVLA
jgi:hypothetical protein